MRKYQKLFAYIVLIAALVVDLGGLVSLSSQVLAETVTEEASSETLIPTEAAPSEEAASHDASVPGADSQPSAEPGSQPETTDDPPTNPNTVDAPETLEPEQPEYEETTDTDEVKTDESPEPEVDPDAADEDPESSDSDAEEHDTAETTDDEAAAEEDVDTTAEDASEADETEDEEAEDSETAETDDTDEEESANEVTGIETADTDNTKELAESTHEDNTTLEISSTTKPVQRTPLRAPAPPAEPTEEDLQNEFDEDNRKTSVGKKLVDKENERINELKTKAKTKPLTPEEKAELKAASDKLVANAQKYIEVEREKLKPENINSVGRNNDKIAKYNETQKLLAAFDRKAQAKKLTQKDYVDLVTHLENLELSRTLNNKEEELQESFGQLKNDLGNLGVDESKSDEVKQEAQAVIDEYNQVTKDYQNYIDQKNDIARSDEEIAALLEQIQALKEKAEAKLVDDTQALTRHYVADGDFDLKVYNVIDRKQTQVNFKESEADPEPDDKYALDGEKKYYLPTQTQADFLVQFASNKNLNSVTITLKPGDIDSTVTGKNISYSSVLVGGKYYDLVPGEDEDTYTLTIDDLPSGVGEFHLLVDIDGKLNDQLNYQVEVTFTGDNEETETKTQNLQLAVTKSDIGDQAHIVGIGNQNEEQPKVEDGGKNTPDGKVTDKDPKTIKNIHLILDNPGTWIHDVLVPRSTPDPVDLDKLNVEIELPKDGDTPSEFVPNQDENYQGADFTLKHDDDKNVDTIHLELEKEKVTGNAKTKDLDQAVICNFKNILMVDEEEGKYFVIYKDEQDTQFPLRQTEAYRYKFTLNSTDYYSNFIEGEGIWEGKKEKDELDDKTLTYKAVKADDKNNTVFHQDTFTINGKHYVLDRENNTLYSYGDKVYPEDVLEGSHYNKVDGDEEVAAPSIQDVSGDRVITYAKDGSDYYGGVITEEPAKDKEGNPLDNVFIVKDKYGEPLQYQAKKDGDKWILIDEFGNQKTEDFVVQDASTLTNKAIDENNRFLSDEELAKNYKKIEGDHYLDPKTGQYKSLNADGTEGANFRKVDNVYYSIKEDDKDKKDYQDQFAGIETADKQVTNEESIYKDHKLVKGKYFDNSVEDILKDNYFRLPNNTDDPCDDTLYYKEALKDADGNPIKDDEGNVKYVYRRVNTKDDYTEDEPYLLSAEDVELVVQKGETEEDNKYYHSTILELLEKSNFGLRFPGFTTGKKQPVYDLKANVKAELEGREAPADPEVDSIFREDGFHTTNYFTLKPDEPVKGNFQKLIPDDLTKGKMDYDLFNFLYRGEADRDKDQFIIDYLQKYQDKELSEEEIKNLSDQEKFANRVVHEFNEFFGDKLTYDEEKQSFLVADQPITRELIWTLKLKSSKEDVPYPKQDKALIFEDYHLDNRLIYESIILNSSREEDEPGDSKLFYDREVDSIYLGVNPNYTDYANAFMPVIKLTAKRDADGKIAFSAHNVLTNEALSEEDSKRIQVEYKDNKAYINLKDFFLKENSDPATQELNPYEDFIQKTYNESIVTYINAFTDPNELAKAFNLKNVTEANMAILKEQLIATYTVNNLEQEGKVNHRFDAIQIQMKKDAKADAEGKEIKISSVINPLVEVGYTDEYGDLLSNYGFFFNQYLAEAAKQYKKPLSDLTEMQYRACLKQAAEKTKRLKEQGDISVLPLSEKDEATGLYQAVKETEELKTFREELGIDAREDDLFNVFGYYSHPKGENRGTFANTAICYLDEADLYNDVFDSDGGRRWDPNPPYGVLPTYGGHESWDGKADTPKPSFGDEVEHTKSEFSLASESKTYPNEPDNKIDKTIENKKDYYYPEDPISFTIGITINELNRTAFLERYSAIMNQAIQEALKGTESAKAALAAEKEAQNKYDVLVSFIQDVERKQQLEEQLNKITFEKEGEKVTLDDITTSEGLTLKWEAGDMTDEEQDAYREQLDRYLKLRQSIDDFTSETEPADESAINLKIIKDYLTEELSDEDKEIVATADYNTLSDLLGQLKKDKAQVYKDIVEAVPFKKDAFGQEDALVNLLKQQDNTELTEEQKQALTTAENPKKSVSDIFVDYNKRHDHFKREDGTVADHMLYRNAVLADILPPELEFADDTQFDFTVHENVFVMDGANAAEKALEQFKEKMQMIRTDDLYRLYTTMEDEAVKARIESVIMNHPAFAEAADLEGKLLLAQGRKAVIVLLPDFEAPYQKSNPEDLFTLKIQNLKIAEIAKELVRNNTANFTSSSWSDHDSASYQIGENKNGYVNKYLRLYEKDAVGNLKPIVDQEEWFKGSGKIHLGQAFDYRINKKSLSTTDTSAEGGFNQKLMNQEVILEDILPTAEAGSFRALLREKVYLLNADGEADPDLEKKFDFIYLDKDGEPLELGENGLPEDLGQVFGIRVKLKKGKTFDPATGLSLVIPMQVPELKVSFKDGKAVYENGDLFDLDSLVNGDKIKAENQVEDSNKVTLYLDKDGQLTLVKRWYDGDHKELDPDATKDLEAEFRIKRKEIVDGQETDVYVYTDENGQEVRLKLNAQNDFQASLGHLPTSYTQIRYTLVDGQWQEEKIEITYEYEIEELTQDGWKVTYTTEVEGDSLGVVRLAENTLLPPPPEEETPPPEEETPPPEHEVPPHPQTPPEEGNPFLKQPPQITKITITDLPSTAAALLTSEH